ncbi:MAG: SPOR domain-containing protein, partial [Alphaproteobacteria bacterium]|nr:SPOR domain-containing protein [Alphaproteobacteria bacterium]
PEKTVEKPAEKTSPLPTPARTVDAPPVAAMGRVVEAAVPAKPTNKPVKPPAAFDMSKDAPPAKQPEPEVLEKEPAQPEPAAAPAKEVAAPEDNVEPVDAGPKSKARIVEPKKTVAEDVQDDAEQAAEPAKKSAEGKGHFQIASFFDKPSADKALAQFKSKYADELDGAGLSIATATINGGKQVFRIQGTASSANVASSICSGIKSKGGSCVTIK